MSEEFKGGLNAFNNPHRNPEQRNNWNSFWDKIEQEKLKKKQDDEAQATSAVNTR
jgi:hypothetical protein